jgi:hypothetical protein
MWCEFTDLICLVAAACTSALLHFGVFWSEFLGPFGAELACGTSAALCAFIPAPKVRHAQIQHPYTPVAFSMFCVFSTAHQVHSVLSAPAALVLRFAPVFPPPRYKTRRLNNHVLLWHSPCFACLRLHFQVHSLPGAPAALVRRCARLSPPPRYKTRRFMLPRVPIALSQ